MYGFPKLDAHTGFERGPHMVIKIVEGTSLRMIEMCGCAHLSRLLPARIPTRSILRFPTKSVLRFQISLDREREN